MDDVEKYHQRQQAIEERRRQLEEEERQKREAEDEWLKLAQEKRKCLREQWLSEPPPPPVPTSAAAEGPETADPLLQDTTQEVSECQQTPQERVETADVREHESTAPPNENTHPFSGTHNHYQAVIDEDLLRQVLAAADPTESMYRESRQDGRSVLGMVAVQVERDPKTGATVVRSVAPVAGEPGAAADMTVPVFDDGRKSVHAVGGAAGLQPSAEELGQILSAVDGVGMRVLLDDVTVVTPPRENRGRLDSAGGAHGGDKEEAEERDVAVVVREVAGTTDEAEYTGAEYRMEDGPVTLTFMGYADGQDEEEEEGQGQGGALTVERVIITDDGEEKVLGPALKSNGEGLKDPSAHEGVFQDIPLNTLKAPAEEEEGGKDAAGSPTRQEDDEGQGAAPKRKACQCCSVM